MARTTEQVFEDHLECRARGALDDDLARNYAEDVVLLCEVGVRNGLEGIRWSAERLRKQVPGQPYIVST